MYWHHSLLKCFKILISTQTEPTHRILLEDLDLVTREAILLNSKGYLLCKATLSKQGDVAKCIKTELGKMTKQKNMFQIKEQDRTSKK